jgi:hypothetical protein
MASNISPQKLVTHLPCDTTSSALLNSYHILHNQPTLQPNKTSTTMAEAPRPTRNQIFGFMLAFRLEQSNLDLMVEVVEARLGWTI